MIGTPYMLSESSVIVIGILVVPFICLAASLSYRYYNFLFSPGPIDKLLGHITREDETFI